MMNLTEIYSMFAYGAVRLHQNSVERALGKESGREAANRQRRGARRVEIYGSTVVTVLSVPPLVRSI